MHSARNSTTTLATNACAGLAAVLLAAVATTDSARAQAVTQAYYPLNTDLLDATANYAPAALTGNPTPPNQPANGVCVNGVYSLSPGGQDVRFPVITTLDTTDFEFSVEFNITALPSTFGAPVFMGGHLWRWLGIYVQPSGIVGLKHNNSNLAWSTTTLATGTWYTGTVKFETGTVELYINGTLALQASVGPLSTGSATIDNRNFTTNDFSNGLNHNGCIRNVVIANDTTLGTSAGAFAFGTGCDNLTLGANGSPTLGNATFELVASNVSPTLPLVFFGFGTAAVTPGADLTPIGMAGCFGYTNLDLGLFGPAVASSNIATFPLPIPSNTALIGTVLSSQAIGFTPTTTLGLSSSNGVQIVLGA
jgi:hypothetical protein